MIRVQVEVRCDNSTTGGPAQTEMIAMDWVIRSGKDDSKEGHKLAEQIRNNIQMLKNRVQKG